MTRGVFALLALVLLLIGPVGVVAQDGSPVAGVGAALDLAAMALAPEDVQEGFFDDYGEWWVPVAAIDGVIGDAAPPDGSERAYQTFYGSLDGGTVSHVFLLEFESPTSAEAGAGIVAVAVRPPFVAVSVSAFAAPKDALAVLDAIRQALNDLPTAYPVPPGVRTIAADPVISGATAALAFAAAFNEEDPSTIDSAGVDVVVGSWLVTVDVQGGLSADAAMAAAIDLATQQAGCLVAGGSCATVTSPAALTVDGSATPTA